MQPAEKSPVTVVALLAIALALFLALIAEAAPRVRRDREEGGSRNVEDRYIAVFRDGTSVIGREVRNWHEKTQQPSLNNRNLFDPGNPLRLLRDTTITSKLEGPYVEFANGDVLPGRVIGGSPADAFARLPAHLLVTPQGPLAPFEFRERQEIAVHPESVSRIVLSREPRGPLEPGTVVFADGRRVKVKALKWVLGGIRGLTEEGSVSAGWVELAEVHPPGGAVIPALVNELLSPAPKPQQGSTDLVGRIVVGNGATLTYRRSMMQIDHERRGKVESFDHIVQPAWAMHALRVPFDEIVLRGYREVNDVPLSLLPAHAASQKSATGFIWPWRRNASSRGLELQLGTASGDLGVGTHSYSEIEFELPPHARSFSTWVGINRAVGKGGCAKVKIVRDKVGGPVLWESGFLRGGEDPQRVGPLDIKGAARLVLVTDFGHDGRPKGSDPLDIRDEVDWLWPSVTVDAAAAAKDRPPVDLAGLWPQLAEWTVDKSQLARLTLRPWWSRREGRWLTSAVIDADKPADQVAPLELTRRVKITHANAWLPVTASRDDTANSGHEFNLLVDKERADSMLNGDVKTLASPPGDFNDRIYSLGPWIGKEVTLRMQIKPNSQGNAKLAGLLFGQMTMLPLVTGLDGREAPIVPQVSITSLKAKSATFSNDRKLELKPGKTIDGKPLVMHLCAFQDGYGVTPFGSEITYDLDPSWKKFVAVVGMCDGWQGAGPFEVSFDGDVRWRNDNPAVLSRTDQLQQAVVEIPAGAKTITLRVDKKSPAAAAWANAGFLK